MRALVRYSAISRLGGAVAAMWLCGAGSAWAGGGGQDAGFLQANLLNPICQFLGIESCQQLPTVSQIIIEVSALQNIAPNYVRSYVIPGLQDVSDTCTVPGGGLFSFPVCDKVAVSAVNQPLVSANAQQNQNAQNQQPPNPVSLSDLPGLSPLGFTVNSQGQVVPVPSGPGNGATALFYAAVASGTNGQPDRLKLYYDYPGLTNPFFTNRQVVAEISLPLQVLSKKDGSERLVCGAQASGSTKTSCAVSLATLQIIANCTGGPNCLTGTVIGDFTSAGTIDSPPPSAAALGLNFGVVFAPSPNFPKPHAIFGVSAPLLVTGPVTQANATACGTAIDMFQVDTLDCGNDPAYFGVTPSLAANGNSTGFPTGINQYSGLPTAFSPFSSKDMVPVGIAPYAAPQTIGDGSMATFGYCASFLANGAIKPQPAVAAFLGIGTDATTYVSSPVPPVSTPAPQCPF
jgi:hypothetical protein